MATSHKSHSRRTQMTMFVFVILSVSVTFPDDLVLLQVFPCGTASIYKLLG